MVIMLTTNSSCIVFYATLNLCLTVHMLSQILSHLDHEQDETHSISALLSKSFSNLDALGFRKSPLANGINFPSLAIL